jgi:multidrug resistance efflux pump
MSSTLDKLKALNDKLEAKLSAQEQENQKGSSASKTRTRKTSAKQKTATVSFVELAKILIKQMAFETASEPIRAENLQRVAELYVKLGIIEKAPQIEELFIYKAMNISGIGLKEEDFGEIREGKYVQVIAITYEPDKNGKKKAKNISLGYFGKAETLEESYKNEIIEFVLRWRYEKAFQNLEHYKDLLDRVRPS